MSEIATAKFEGSRTLLFRWLAGLKTSHQLTSGTSGKTIMLKVSVNIRVEVACTRVLCCDIGTRTVCIMTVVGERRGV